MGLELMIGTVGVTRSNFGNNLRDEIAFDIAFIMGMRCDDKKAMLEAIYMTADEIIEKVKI